MVIFPKLNNIEPVLKAIEGREGFKILPRGNDETGKYSIINYGISSSGIFPEITSDMSEQDVLTARLLRECRGIIFDDKTGDILRRPFHKFFNINENAETSLEKINVDDIDYATLKHDGVFIAPFYTPNKQLVIASKRGYSDLAKDAEKYITEKPQYKDCIEDALSMGFTPIFEFLNPDYRIVVPYEHPDLVLLSLRDMCTGEYMSPEFLKRFVMDYTVPHIRYMRIHSTMDAFIERSRGIKDIEGYVLSMCNGEKYKIKTDWYRERSNMYDLALRVLKYEKDLIKVILENKLDDLLPMMRYDQRDHVKEYAHVFMHNFQKTVRDYDHFYSKYKTLPRPEFSSLVKKHPASSLFFKMYTNDTNGILNRIDDLMKEQILIACNRQGSGDLESVRHMFGDIKYRPIAFSHAEL